MAPQSSLSAVTTTISSASSPSASPALTSPWIAAHPSKSRSWSSSSWSALSSSSSSSSSTAELRHRDQRLLPYSQKQLFDLISDVNNYHLFVPWCVSSRVLSRKTITIPGPPSTLTSKATAPPITKTLMRAELGVGFQAANENYISDVICVHSSKIQAVASNSAVFKTLTTTWSLTPQAGPKPTSKAPLTKGPVRQHPHPASKLACPTPAPLARSAVERPSSPAAAKPAPASDLVSSDLPYCMVDFSIAFEFRSALYSGLAQLFMTEVSQQMVRAFEERARAVYGGGGNRSFGLDRGS